jgi:glycine dehydrogenase
VPLGCGGPGAGFLATRDALKRLMPGRLVGVSKDAQGQPALRLALGTREQHIRREKATSNICTAQVLLAVMASMYAVYHGPDGLKAIASRVHHLTRAFAAGLAQLGYRFNNAPVFGTLTVELGDISAERIHDLARAHRLNLRPRSPGSVGVSFDETATEEDLALLLRVFAEAAGKPAPALASLRVEEPIGLPAPFARTSRFLDHPVFNRHHTEHEMLRYIRRLEAKDLSLCHSMIPLGSCTMKLNATGEMLPITWPEFARIHPFAPAEQTAGYRRSSPISNAGSPRSPVSPPSRSNPTPVRRRIRRLLVIRAWHASRGERSRDICLIPTSAHGTNPASAAMAGLKVVPVACDPQGNIDLADLRAKAAQHAAALAAVMVTYPSTHGVFETGIRELCGSSTPTAAGLHGRRQHERPIGLTSPGHIGADVCHLNLHKTFAIPHGGGGPGVGPICVAST